MSELGLYTVIYNSLSKFFIDTTLHKQKHVDVLLIWEKELWIRKSSERKRLPHWIERYCKHDSLKYCGKGKKYKIYSLYRRTRWVIIHSDLEPTVKLCMWTMYVSIRSNMVVLMLHDCIILCFYTSCLFSLIFHCDVNFWGLMMLLNFIFYYWYLACKWVFNAHPLTSPRPPQHQNTGTIQSLLSATPP